MIICVFRNDDLVYEYLSFENGFFWRVVEIEKEAKTKKFVHANELRRYFPWIDANTLPYFMAMLGVEDYKNNRQFHVYFYEGTAALTKQPSATLVGACVEDVIKNLKAMKVVQELIKEKGTCRIWDTMSDKVYWSWDGDCLERITDR